MLCQSSHFITNGYSYVGYNLAKHIAQKKDIDLIYWGFQKFSDNPEHNKQRELPSNVTIYDAWANENPKGLGFGFDQIVEYVNQNKPNVIVIYNDFVVVSNILEKLKTCTYKDFKVIVYIDQVYLSQKKESNSVKNCIVIYRLKRVKQSLPTFYNETFVDETS